MKKFRSLFAAAALTFVASSSIADVVILEGKCREFCQKHTRNKLVFFTLARSTMDERLRAYVAEHPVSDWKEVARCKSPGWFAVTIAQRLPQISDTFVWDNAGGCGYPSGKDAVAAVVARCSQKSGGNCATSGSLTVFFGVEKNGEGKFAACMFTADGVVGDERSRADPELDICTK